ncbi:MAG: hypothetical protein CBD18_06220 [Opitutales bacterium TMED158]|nr:MAG: hypothetical protein CBD18_06220 [Opitutales bacterium TMED158]
MTLDWSEFPSESGDLASMAHSESSQTSNETASSWMLANGSDWRNPLDEEMENIVSDAQGALDFLADSFLPSSMTPIGQPKS